MKHETYLVFGVLCLAFGVSYLMFRVRSQTKHKTQNTIQQSPLADWLPLFGAGWFLVFCFYFYSFQLPNAAAETYRIDIWRLLPEIVSQDLFPASQGRPSGWEYLPQRADLVACATLILLASFALGRMVLRATRLPAGCDAPLRWALAGGIGLSLASLWALFAGLCGLLNQALFFTFYLAAIAAELWFCLRRTSDASLKETAPASAGRGTPSRKRHWSCVAWLAVMAPFIGVMMLGAMLPSQDFDVKEYHLEGPKEYFLNGRITFLRDNVYTSFPFLTEMLSLSGMVLRGDWYRGALVGKLVLMSFAPLTALGAYALAGRIAGPRAGWLAALFYLSTPWAYRISIIAYAEGALACYVMLTLLALFLFGDFVGGRVQYECRQIRNPKPEIRNKSETRNPHTSHAIPESPSPEQSRIHNPKSTIPPAFVALWRFGLVLLRATAGEFIIGLLAGSAAATKYPGLVFVIIPAAIALFALRVLSVLRGPTASEVKSPQLPALGRSAAAFSLGVFIALGPWLIKNIAETGNPVYPLAYSIFGGTDWNDELHEKWKRAHGPPADRFTNPRLLKDRLIDVVARSDWQGPLLFGFAPCAFLVHRSRRISVGVLAGYVLFFFIGWYALTHHIDRFWVPMIPAVAVLAGIGATVLQQRLFQATGELEPPLHMLPFTLSIAVGLSTMASLVFNWAFMTTASCGYNAYLLDEAAAMRESTTPSIALLNGRIKSGEKVLFVGEAQVFDARFPYRYNTVFDFNLLEEWCIDRKRATAEDPYPLLPAAQVRKRLHDEGITHVFVNWNEVLRYREPGSYGYTDFVSPRRFRQLQELGVLTTVPLSPTESLIPWEGLSPARRKEIERWGPELKSDHYGIQAARIYDLYRVPR